MNMNSETIQKLKSALDKASSAPWFDNPYRATIGQQNPKESPDVSKRTILLLDPVVETTEFDRHIICMLRNLADELIESAESAIRLDFVNKVMSREFSDLLVRVKELEDELGAIKKEEE